MQLNWKVRIKNKLFWLALIPAVLILAETVCRLFGVTVETGDLKEQLLNLVNAVFAVLAVLGIVVDPTTEGLSDSIIIRREIRSVCSSSPGFAAL